MIPPEEVRKMALNLESVTEATHHHILSFKVKSRVFATLNLQEKRACLKLSANDQDVFSTIQKEIIYPVPNAWGKYGWTLVNLRKTRKRIFKDALQCAYDHVISESFKKKQRNKP